MRSNLTSHQHLATVCRNAASLLITSPVDPAFTHRLGGILHSLYVIAVILGILLAISLVVALWAFRRNRDMEPKA